MKKSKIIFAVAFVLVSAFVLVNSCSKEPECKTCHVEITNANDSVLETKDYTEYCAEELTNIEAEAPITIDGRTSKNVCE